MAQSQITSARFESFCDVIYAKKDVNIADLAAGADAHLNVTVTGVALGDVPWGVGAPGADVTDVIFTVQVTADDVVTISAVNQTGDHINLGTSEWNMMFLRPKGNWASQIAD